MANEDDLLGLLAAALAGELVMVNWCVELYDADDTVIYHCHLTLPTTNPIEAAGAAAHLATHQNVSLAGLAGFVAAATGATAPEDNAEMEKARLEWHKGKPPVKFNPELGYATAEGLPDGTQPAATHKGKHLH